ncbi:MAG TPA: type II toxin-antitoxin system VapC family toxin [Acetobacteraceae bacterium]|nr:type II toxin-antitoxin system VapC family toxin [Acetobacteraceae bacterium]
MDASVTLAALIEEERSAEAREILRAVIDDSAVVPGLWFLEVGNVLLIAERRRSLTAAARRDHLDDLSRLPIVIDNETAGHAWHETMEHAVAHRLTLYDAAYLELSLRRQLPLATFDTALRRAAAAAGVGLV